mgnify:CR=1 FL=1
MQNPCITPILCNETRHCCGGCQPKEWMELERLYVIAKQTQMLYDKQTKKKSKNSRTPTQKSSGC